MALFYGAVDAHRMQLEHATSALKLFEALEGFVPRKRVIDALSMLIVNRASKSSKDTPYGKTLCPDLA